MSSLFQLTVAGGASGCLYALIALGFVIVFRSTGVFNLTQGAFVLIGAQVAATVAGSWGWPFPIAIVAAVAATAAVGALVQVAVVRRLLGAPVFAVVMVTLGMLIVLEEMASWLWGTDHRPLGDPWSRTFVVRGVVIEESDVAIIVLTSLALAAYYLVLRRSRFGVAMQATAVDDEAAALQGIPIATVGAVSWAIAGAVGALGGILASAGAGATVSPSLATLALLSIPAMILGGLESPGGTVLAGLLLGLSQSLARGWETGALSLDVLPGYPAWLGSGFFVVLPFVLMVIVLQVRPHGLFGVAEVRRG